MCSPFFQYHRHVFLQFIFINEVRFVFSWNFFLLFFFFEIGLKQIHGIDILFTIRNQDTRTYHDKKIEFQTSQHTHSTTTKGNPCLNSSAFFRCWGYVYIYMHAPQVFRRINLLYSADTVTVHNRQEGLARVKVQLCRVAWRGNPTQVRERGRVEVIKMHSSIEIHMSLTAATLNCHPSAKLGYNDNPIFFSLFFTLSLFFPLSIVSRRLCVAWTPRGFLWLQCEGFSIECRVKMYGLQFFYAHRSLDLVFFLSILFKQHSS